MSVLIRPFRKTDFETLWQIDQVCFDPELAYSRPELAYYMKRSRAFTLVAETAETAKGERELPVVGFIVAELSAKAKDTGSAGHIITIDVIPEARTTGVGSALLNAAESKLMESGATLVVLETAVNNEVALRFYKSKGYFIESTTPRYYSNQLDAFVMRKDLARSVVALQNSAQG